MTIAYSVNAGTEVLGVESRWERIAQRINGDGTSDFSPWAWNIWMIKDIKTAPYETLQALQGAALVSLETNDIDDRNTGATYTMVFLHDIENEGQFGQTIRGTIVRFMVKVS